MGHRTRLRCQPRVHGSESGVLADQAPGSGTDALLVEVNVRPRGEHKDGNADATAYRAPSGAYVFASGSLQFSWGLTDFPWNPEQQHGLASSNLQRFVTNMFDAMTGERHP